MLLAENSTIQVQRVPNFRWRLIPAVPSLLFGTFVFALSVFQFTSPAWTLTNQGFITLAGLLWIVSAIACFRGRFWIAGLIALSAFLLPFLRPVIW
jgi:glucose uptake protein GlcU